VGTDAVFGFGAWRYEQAQYPDGETSTWINIPRFGVDQRFQGARDPQGRSCAGLLYATLEADALAGPDSHDQMRIQLFCHIDNQRGLAFWRKRGFTLLGLSKGTKVYFQLVR
jgi:ribosomal protein S18 acetylase RimI-like enzyme